MVFHAWLTSVKFYPEGYDYGDGQPSNPFEGAVKLDEDNAYDANYGYPYLPPEVKFGNTVTFPLQVEIRFTYNVASTNEVFERLQVSVDKEKTRRKEATEKAEREEAERLAKQKKRHEAWLASHEGKVCTAEDEMLREMKRLVPQGLDFDSNDLQVFRRLGTAHAEELSFDGVEYAAEYIEDWPAKYKNTKSFGRVEYMKAFAERVKNRAKDEA